MEASSNIIISIEEIYAQVVEDLVLTIDIASIMG